MTVLIPLRKKYKNPSGGAKTIKRTDSGNGKRPGKDVIHGSFTQVRKGDGTGRK